MAMITKDDNDHDKDNDDGDMMREHIAGLTPTQVKMIMTKMLDLKLQRGPNSILYFVFFWFWGKITNHPLPSIFPQSYRACDIFSWPHAPFVVRGRPPNTK